MIHLHGFELTIGMYMRMCVYVYVHIGADIYLRGYVKCERQRKTTQHGCVIMQPEMHESRTNSYK